MKIDYSEKKDTTEAYVALNDYRTHVRSVIESDDYTQSESSLATCSDELMKEGVERIITALGPVKHVVLIGIGGSALGTEAIHYGLGGKTTLHVLDSVAPFKIVDVVEALRNVPREDMAICAISKSGGTAETLTNIAVLLDELEKEYGEKPYDRLVCIGDPGNALLTAGAALGAHVLPMHEAVGGRYSVFTAVGVLPLALLGHDAREILRGVSALMEEGNEEAAATGAAVLYGHMMTGVRNVNFFAFDARLEKMGKWYRQLTAESLGKEEDLDGKKVESGFVPTISTPVELHSIGQLYFSGFKGVYTDLISFEENVVNFTVPKDSKIAARYAGKSTSEVHHAIYGGVIGAYDERDLPYRTTELSFGNAYDLGLFVATRMLETMYIAKLMNVNAFDQPNVETYKNITRDILGV